MNATHIIYALGGQSTQNSYSKCLTSFTCDGGNIKSKQLIKNNKLLDLLNPSVVYIK